MASRHERQKGVQVRLFSGSCANPCFYSAAERIEEVIRIWNFNAAARIAQAAAAFNLLDEYKIDLLEAVRAHIKAHKQGTASIAYVELFNQFLESKEDRSDSCLYELSITRDRFPTLHELKASDIGPRDIDPLLDGLGASASQRLHALFAGGI